MQIFWKRVQRVSWGDEEGVQNGKMISCCGGGACMYCIEIKKQQGIPNKTVWNAKCKTATTEPHNHHHHNHVVMEQPLSRGKNGAAAEAAALVVVVLVHNKKRVMQ